MLEPVGPFIGYKESKMQDPNERDSFIAMVIFWFLIALAFVVLTYKCYAGPAEARAAWMNHTATSWEALIAARDMGEGAAGIKAGDIVAVRPAGWGWGRKETDPRDFKVVKVDKMNRGQAEALMRAELDAEGKLVRSRRFAFSVLDAGTTKDATRAVIGDKKLQKLVTAAEAESADKPVAVGKDIQSRYSDGLKRRLRADISFFKSTVFYGDSLTVQDAVVEWQAELARLEAVK